jgi:hypothetical protein
MCLYLWSQIVFFWVFCHARNSLRLSNLWNWIKMCRFCRFWWWYITLIIIIILRFLSPGFLKTREHNALEACILLQVRGDNTLFFPSGRANNNHWTTDAEVRSWTFILRPTVSLSVCLRVGHTFGAYDHSLNFLLSNNYFLLHVGLSLWREDESVVCSAIIHWSESRRPITKYYFLIWDPNLEGQVSVFILPGTGWPS